MSDTRQYGRLGSFVTVCEDLRDIGRRLDALESGRRSSEPEQREVGWYPVQIIVGDNEHRSWPLCMWWSGNGWRRLPADKPVEDMSDKFVAAIGPRLDLPEGR
jgi:hypothetical protein